MKSMIVVDCQYDFIDGTLACENAEEAVENIINYINKNKLSVNYSMDWHTKENKSFGINGGTWPVHCVQGERGARLHEDFYISVNDPSMRPLPSNTYYKGMDDTLEEYSAFGAKNQFNEVLKDKIHQDVVVAGIASEYCVRETVLALLEAGHKVLALKDSLGYVNYKDHIDNLKDLKDRGVEVISSIWLKEL